MERPLEIILDHNELFPTMGISPAAIVPHNEEAIALAGDTLEETDDIAYEAVRAAHADREALGSTAPRKGIAISHAVARGYLCTTLSLIDLATLVDFDAAVVRGANGVLALIWPQHRVGDLVRFSLLANYLASDPAVLDAVRETGAPGRIRTFLHARSCAPRSSIPVFVRTTGHGFGLQRL